MRISLRVKLILSHLLPILVLLPFFGFYIISTIHEFYIGQLKEDLLQRGALLADALQMNPALTDDNGSLQELLLRADTQTPTRIQIIDQTGIILASTESADAPLIGTINQDSALKAALAGKESTETSANDVVTVAVPVISAGHIGAILLSLQNSDVAATFNRLDQLVITGILAITLSSLVVSFFIGLTISRSLHKLTYEVRSIAEGDYSRHLQVSGEVEIADLARFFNDMVDRLAEQRTSRAQLLNDIAHELRRPISSLRAAIEVVHGAPVEYPEPIKHLLDALQGEMDRLGRLTERLSFIAWDKSTSVLSKQESIDISATVNRTVLLFGPESRRLGIRLMSETSEKLSPVKVDEDALIEICSNLIDNALKFTPRGGQVSVTVGKTQDRLWIQIGDTGIGLTQDEQNHLFQRFYMGDKTRMRPYGHGLGLAITYELVQEQGGTIRFSSELDRGTTFRVELPL